MAEITMPTSSGAVIAVESLNAGAETETMHFPKEVMLLHDGKHIKFKAGVQEVPSELVSHWWLKHEGATMYRKAPPQGVSPITAQHAEFIKTKGFSVDTVEQAKAFYRNLTWEQQAGFLKEAEAYFASVAEEVEQVPAEIDREPVVKAALQAKVVKARRA